VLTFRARCFIVIPSPADGIEVIKGQVAEFLIVTQFMKKKTSKKKWVASVHTDATHPPEGLFTKPAATIARTLASKKVSPKGPGSGMRMLTYFINRAGKGLSTTRRKELERAKALLSKRAEKEKTKSSSLC